MRERFLTPESVSSLRERLAAYEPYSDFNALSLLCYGRGRFSFIQCEGADAFVFRDYIEPGVSVSIHPSGDQPAATRRSIAAIMDRFEISTLRLMPAEAARRVAKARPASIIPDPDNSDHILSTRDAASMSGPRFRRRRRAIRDRATCAGLIAIDHAPELDSGVATALQGFFNAERDRRGDAGPATRFEAEAFNACMELAPRFAGAFTLRVDRAVAGYLVYETCRDPAWAICHFFKADRRHNWAGGALVQAACAQLAERGGRHLNFEQDLGLPGLRDFKRSCGSTLLDKYTLHLADGL